MSNRTGAGRPNAATFVTSWDETIDGAYKGKDGKLRPIGRSRPAFSLKDEARAVHRFKRWQATNGKQPKPRVPVVFPDSDVAFDALFPNAPNSDHLTPAVEAPTENLSPLASELEWLLQQERKRLHDLILTNPRQAAIELDVDYLAFYPERPEKPQFALRELADYYCENKRNKKGRITHSKWQQNVRLAWGPTPKNGEPPKDKRKRKKRLNMPKTAFLDIVQVKHLRDVRQSHINAYCSAILDEFTEYNRSPSWIKTRYRAVKAVLSFILKVIDETEKAEYRRVLDLCKVLEEPDDESNPSPIAPEHYRALVEAAKPREKAILLLGANCLMHSGEAATTLKVDVLLENATLAARRTKNREPRIAKLWARTIKAIREYQKRVPDNSEFLFVTKFGTPMSGENMRQIIVRLRRRLKLPEFVTFEGIKDAGYEVAEEVDSKRAPWIAGHKTGQKDKYILRRADSPRIRKCCEAIERHYFGKRS